MSRPNPKETVESLLKAKFPQFKCAFVAGSILRGDGTKFSDLDVVVIFDQLENAWRESVVQDGWPVELFMHDKETLQYFFDEMNRPEAVPSLANMISEGEIIGNSEFAQKFKIMANEFIQAGPPKCTEDYINQMRYAITDKADDIRDPRNKHELWISAQELLNLITQLYFRVNGYWVGEGKHIFRRLDQVNLSLATQLREAIEKVNEKEDPSRLLEVTEEIIRPHGGFFFDGFKRSAPTTWRKINPLGERIVNKAVAYITRKKLGGYELLVFDHDPQYSDAGTQVPAGTVDAGEDPRQAVFREILEESGLKNLSIESKIDEYVFWGDIAKKYLRRHVFHLVSNQQLPDRWTHRVQGPGTDEGLNFHYFWIPLHEAKGRLSGRFDDSIEKLIQYFKLKEQITFEPINLEQDFRTCVQFRIDSYVCSFGSPDNYERDGGDKHYLEFLQAKLSKDPHSAVHVKFNGKIIGQMELGKIRQQPEIGYVNLYYLAPEYRGKGFSAFLDQYATEYLKSLGHHVARLSVSPTNTRALKYYKKHGWRDLGPRPGSPEVHFMEKNLV